MPSKVIGISGFIGTSVDFLANSIKDKLKISEPVSIIDEKDFLIKTKIDESGIKKEFRVDYTAIVKAINQKEGLVLVKGNFLYLTRSISISLESGTKQANDRQYSFKMFGGENVNDLIDQIEHKFFIRADGDTCLLTYLKGLSLKNDDKDALKKALEKYETKIKFYNELIGQAHKKIPVVTNVKETMISESIINELVHTINFDRKDTYCKNQ